MSKENFNLDTSFSEIEIIKPKTKTKRVKKGESNKSTTCDGWSEKNFETIKPENFEPENRTEVFFEGNDPLSYFKHFLTEQVATYIAKLTSKKILDKNPNNEVITSEEIYKYFGVLIGMGLKNLSNYKNYWDQNSRFYFCEINLKP